MILPLTQTSFIVRTHKYLMQSHSRVKMDYKPKDTERPLFNQAPKKRWRWWVAGLSATIVLVNGASLAKDYLWHQPSQARSQIETIALPNTQVQQPKSKLSEITEATWKTVEVKPGDSLATLFNKNGVAAQELHNLLEIGHNSNYLVNLYPGQEIKLLVNDQGKLLAFNQKIDALKSLHIERQKDKFISTLQNTPVENRITYGRAVIHDSVFLSGKKAGLEDKLIMELADIFTYDIDFALDIHPNDAFKILYEEKYVDGQKIGVGAILAAEFSTRGKTFHAIRYTDSNGKSDYYTQDGKSLKKTFIRTPVKYTRISSHFNLQRRHPVLHKIRAHKGVDYAAPRGTHVKASGDGTVLFVGRKGGYGNTVILQHGSKYTTLYAHLTRYSKHLKKGTKVKQGEVIGAVGSSGLATGPHLHYEFRINGVHRNPLTVALPQAQGIDKGLKSEFLAHANNLLGLIDYHDRVMLASSESIH